MSSTASRDGIPTIATRPDIVNKGLRVDAHRVSQIRVITSRAYHALFMHNMLIRPTEEELLNFGEPDYTIYNGGAFPANRATDGMSSGTSVSLNFATREVVILGTQYAGEMKKDMQLSLYVYMCILINIYGIYPTYEYV